MSFLIWNAVCYTFLRFAIFQCGPARAQTIISLINDANICTIVKNLFRFRATFHARAHVQRSHYSVIDGETHFRTSKNNAVHCIRSCPLSRHDDCATDCFMRRFDKVHTCTLHASRPWREMGGRCDFGVSRRESKTNKNAINTRGKYRATFFLSITLLAVVIIFTLFLSPRYVNAAQKAF